MFSRYTFEIPAEVTSKLSIISPFTPDRMYKYPLSPTDCYNSEDYSQLLPTACTKHVCTYSPIKINNATPPLMACNETDLHFSMV